MIWGFRLMVRHQVPTLKMWVQFLQPLPKSYKPYNILTEGKNNGITYKYLQVQ